jgi:hypothetical protein
MAMHTSRLRAATLLAIIAVAHLSAQTPTADLARIRPESSLLRAVVATTFDRSATFRSLVDRIEHSDVIVHLTCEQFSSLTLTGRTVLVTATAHVRYLRAQILCHQPTQLVVGIVAHELQHVAEIASMPNVIDNRSFGTLFRAIGFATRDSFSGQQFETTAALDVGERVREEWSRRPGPIFLATSLGLDPSRADAQASLPPRVAPDIASARAHRATPAVRDTRNH